MNIDYTVRSQIGIFVEFPDYLGPSIIGLGFLTLVLWFVIFKLLPQISSYEDRGRIPTVTHLSSISIGIGLSSLTLGLVLQAHVFWQFSFLLFLVGRMIEGAVFIRGMKRIFYYISVIFDQFGQHNTSVHSSPLKSLSRKMTRKIIYSAATLLYIFISVLAIAIILKVLDIGIHYHIPIILSVYLGTTTIFMFIWDIKSIIGELNIFAIFGISFCIAGTEIYNFPQIRDWIFPNLDRYMEYQIGSLEFVPSSVSSIEFVVIFIGQLAFVMGVALSLWFIWSSSKLW